MEEERSLYYKLNADKSVSPCSMEEGGACLDGDRTVIQTFVSLETGEAVPRQNGCVRISTIFLVINHAFGDQAPVLFETMTFNHMYDGVLPAALDLEQRYHTHAAALSGHADIVAEVKAYIKNMNESKRKELERHTFKGMLGFKPKRKIDL